MAFSEGLLEGIKKSAPDPVIRIRMYTDPCSDLIGRPKSYALNIISQLIRVLFQNFVYTHTVILVYLCRQFRRDPVLLQVDHGAPHVPLLFHLDRDLPGLAFTDPFDLGQPFRLLLDDPERILLKLLHDPAGKGSPHAFDSAGSQISFNGDQILRFFHCVRYNLQLSAVNIMVYILAGQL